MEYWVIGRIGRIMIQEQSPLWLYLSPEQRALARDGELLIEDRKLHPTEHLSDYSYLVFPFAKLYEGFLKNLFRELGIIDDRQYNSDHFRIGKVLSPDLVGRLGSKSAYGELRKRYGEELPLTLWQTWKTGRNLVFHYYPHNYRALPEDDARHEVDEIIASMEEALRVTGVQGSAASL